MAGTAECAVLVRILTGMWPLVITTALVLGATARLVRLVTTDEFPPVLRVLTYLSRRYGAEHWLNKLLNCPWCLAPWVLAPIMASAWAWSGHLWWRLLTGWLAGAYVVGWMVSRDD
jgi:hypothetical protein